MEADGSIIAAIRTRAAAPIGMIASYFMHTVYTERLDAYATVVL